MLRGVQARARQGGYAVFFADCEEDPAAEEALVRTMARQVDGVVVCAPFASDAQLHALAGVTSPALTGFRVRIKWFVAKREWGIKWTSWPH